MSDRSLDLHGEYQALLDDAGLLREELAHLLTEEYDLLNVVKPNLLALYQQKIGAWELRKLQVQVEAARARRRLEMAQAALNQGYEADLEEIEEALEFEFMTWQQRIQEAVEKLDSAKHRLQHLLSNTEDRQLKKLYYSLVKKLHPDVNAEIGEDQRRLWQRVQAAYEASDLQELQALALLVHEPAPLPSETSLEAMRKGVEALKRHVAAVLQRLEQAESRPPFTLRHQLEDEAWVTERREEVEIQISQFEAQRAALETHLQTLLPPPDDGQIFGNN